MPAHSMSDPPLSSPRMEASNGVASMPKWDVSEDIVISGISGKFPEAEDIQEFRDNLFNKVDMVTDYETRWPSGLYGLPARLGKLRDISKFDAPVFGVHPKQAHQMDPQLRLMLEITYEAIVDAGYDPQTLRGKRVGVFVGCCSSESDEAFTMNPEEINGYGLTGCCRAMFANRVSYTFDFKGPSYAVDTACSSSLLALEQGLLAIRTNQCDAAIVGGLNLCLKPTLSLNFFKLNMLSLDGKCKAFDAAANGYVRAEAAVAVLLQKASDARRVYATLIHAKTNTDGAKEQGVTYPSGEMQKQLLLEVYQETGVNPCDIAFVEAHGTGTKAGDPQEIGAISDVFCKGRNQPLLIGSVKSNMGHSEGASGLCSVAKVLIAMEEGMLPPNLHYFEPNPEIPSLVEGKVKVVSEPTPFNGGLVGINCFGFGGVNVHVLLRSNPREKNDRKDAVSTIPRLFAYCGRTEEAVDFILNHFQEHNVPEETFSLLEESSQTTPSVKPYRGYTILNEDKSAKPIKEIGKLASEKRPVWFVFSGMGSQWSGMARSMMQYDVFAKSIYRTAEVLKPLGVDLIYLLTEATDEELGATIAPFVTIAAVQVALVDILRLLKIEPDGIVGHSVGELGCAYADGCFTAEQMVLAAYWRGRCTEEGNLPHGAMAAVGLTLEEVEKRAPKGVVAACHNSEDSITISGPADLVSKFVKELQAENIFAREVKSCGVAFHSPHVNSIAPALRQVLERIIPNPKPRSSKWISSSVPEEKWGQPAAKYSSAAYHVNNLVSPVLFHEALAHLPSNAITIEIAPHALLQAILKRGLGSSCTCIGLMKRNHPNNIEHMLSSFGKMYMCGMNPAIQNLYGPVSYPVPRATPMLSSLMKWDHSQTWTVATYTQFYSNREVTDSVMEVSLSNPDSEDLYLAGHCIDGRVLFPATGYLLLAWQALAKLKRQTYKSIPVAFEDCVFERATILPKEGSVRFKVSVHEISGEFEVSEGGTVACSGRVYIPEDPVMDLSHMLEDSTADDGKIKLGPKDIYKELRIRGYDYGPTFQGLIEANMDGTAGKLKWTNDSYVPFMDAMFHLSILSQTARGLYLPTRIRSVRLDPRVLEEAIKTHGEEGIPLVYDKFVNVLVTKGVEVRGMKATLAPRKQGIKQVPILEKYQFLKYFDDSVLDNLEKTKIEEYVHVCSALSRRILEACGKNAAQVADVMNGFKEADDAVLQEYLNYPENNQVLLLVLKELYLQGKHTNFQESVVKILQKYQKDMPKDVLSTLLLSDRALRMPLDIVAENVSQIKLKILEVTASNAIHKRVAEILGDSCALLNLNYTLAHPVPEELEGNGINTIKWSISTPAPTDLKDFDLIIVHDIANQQVDYTKSLKTLGGLLKEGGFVLAMERSQLSPAEKFLSSVTSTKVSLAKPEEILRAAESNGLAIVSRQLDDIASCMFLLRKITPLEAANQAVIRVSETKYDWVNELKTKIVEFEQKPKGHNVWLVAEDMATNGIVGLVNCLKQEPGGSRVRCVFTANLRTKNSLPAFSFSQSPYKELLKKDLVMNVFRDGHVGSFRHLKLPESREKEMSEIEHAYLNVATRGDLSSFSWFESSMKYWANSSQKFGTLCHVYYAPLNFRDVMLATGKLPADALPGNLVNEDCILGLEFAGRDDTGRRVMGLVPAKGLATTVAIDPMFLWDVPDQWSLEEACTVPVVYATAYYALVIRGELTPGESVLIHSGSGGVGQAAIAIALSMGCKVFTTVGSKEKREFLKKQFPQLNDESFSNSRDTSFEFDILRATKGQGVDLVLNSLAEEKLQASIRCLAVHGRFLEIGKYDLSQNNPLGMGVFLKNVAFHGILLDALFENGTATEADKKRTVELVSEGIKSGVVRPLKRFVFDKDQAEDAFRFMASGRHMGKVVIKIRDEEPTKIAIPRPIKVKAIKKTTCSPLKSYVIVGGLGGFGLELAWWLIHRGAKKLVLTSRSGAKTGYQHWCLKRWRDMGVNVVVSKLNVSTSNEATKLLTLANELGPVGGIFNLAVVLRDAFLENQTPEMFNEVCKPKADGTHWLDKSSRKLCSELDWFVVFSSVSCGRGNAGQTNYGFANSVMERICEQRRKDGLASIAIQWGVIGDVGIAQETLMPGDGDLVIGGTVPQKIANCLIVLDRFLQQNQAIVSSFVKAESTGHSSDTGDKRNLIEAVAHILGIKDPSSLDPDMTLGDLGLDSLMGVEVKQTLERDYDTTLSMQDIRALTIKKMQAITGSATDSTPATKPTSRESVTMASVEPFLIPKETVVHLNDKRQGTPLFICHPIEGHVDALKDLAALFSCPVIGFQCTADVPLGSMQELGAHFAKYAKEICPSGPYNIAGYSFGTGAAFELAVELRKSNPACEIRPIIMLEGSPLFITLYTALYREKFGISSQQDSETEGLTTFLMWEGVAQDPLRVKSDLSALPDYGSRLDFAAEKLKPVFGDAFNMEKAKATADSFYKRLLLADKYVPTQKFEGKAVLIKAAGSKKFTSHLPEDYDLKKVIVGHVDIHTVPGEHLDFMKNDGAKQVAQIIQEALK